AGEQQADERGDALRGGGESPVDVVDVRRFHAAAELEKVLVGGGILDAGAPPGYVRMWRSRLAASVTSACGKRMPLWPDSHVAFEILVWSSRNAARSSDRAGASPLHPSTTRTTMPDALNDAALKQLFFDARTFSKFQPRPVDEATLHR